MASKQARFHGRVEGARARCAVAGCGAPGEFKAPLQSANFDGPGEWRFLCLDHVREHQLGPFARENPRRRLSDSRSGAGHYCDLIQNTHIRYILSRIASCWEQAKPGRHIGGILPVCPWLSGTDQKCYNVREFGYEVKQRYWYKRQSNLTECGRNQHPKR